MVASSANEQSKPKVFVSYSRDDLASAEQLVEALRVTGFEPFIDREGIHGGEDWKSRLTGMLREADTIAFVLSPSSAKSEVCAWEVAEAVRLGKRILPLVFADLGSHSPPKELRDLNYIFFYNDVRVAGSGFGAGLAKLVSALNTDLGWVRDHTRILLRASEWESSGRLPIRLLSGSDIDDAKAWLARRPDNAVEPTDLHIAFIRASEEERTRASDEARRQLEQMAAATAEREKAISQREEAFRLLRETQRRQLRLRGYALAVSTAIALIAGWQWYEASRQRVLAEKRREMSADLAKLSNLTAAVSINLLAEMIANSASTFDHRRPFGSFRSWEQFKDNKWTYLSIIDGFEKGLRPASVVSPEDFLEAERDRLEDFEAMKAKALAATLVAKGDLRFTRGEMRDAISSYEEALATLDRVSEMNWKLRSNSSNPEASRLDAVRVIGRIGLIGEKSGRPDFARETYAKALARVKSMSEKADADDEWLEEKNWLDERLKAVLAISAK